VTLLLLDPVILAVSVVDCPPESDAAEGETVMPSGVNDIVALALLVASAALVAFTVTVCAEAMVEGAV
jgi:hypothetical protein